MMQNSSDTTARYLKDALNQIATLTAERDAFKDTALAMTEKCERLQAIVGKLPKTADGVPIELGITSYGVLPSGRIYDFEVCGITHWHINDGDRYHFRYDKVFSTRLAAEQAKGGGDAINPGAVDRKLIVRPDATPTDQTQQACPLCRSTQDEMAELRKWNQAHIDDADAHRSAADLLQRTLDRERAEMKALQVAAAKTAGLAVEIGTGQGYDDLRDAGVELADMVKGGPGKGSVGLHIQDGMAGR